MFTYIRLQNFLSFKDTTFDFRDGQKKVKKFIAIYGENGSGKSNFIYSLAFLRETIDSFLDQMRLNKIVEQLKGKESYFEKMHFYSRYLDNSNMLKEARMIGAKEPTRIEYGFEYASHRGSYILSFDDNTYLEENLYYFTGKQSGNVFNIKIENGEIKTTLSEKVFLNTKAKEELLLEIKKYWGKHTLLSLLLKEREEKNDSYIKECYLSYLFDIIDMEKEATIHWKSDKNISNEYETSRTKSPLFRLPEGQIPEDKDELLNRNERILKSFFTQTYPDIKDIYYKKEHEEGMLHYRLYVVKLIGGELRNIPFSKESAGTQKLLEVFKSLSGALLGSTVVYDEIDNGIHDLLMKGIIESMIDNITGQIIITTHNTYLLESVSLKSLYLINVDYLGNKEVICLDEYPTRIQGNNNPRVMYLKGLFGGVPSLDYVDYSTIVEEMENDSEKK